MQVATSSMFQNQLVQVMSQKYIFLSKANRLQCFKVDKEGQIISAVGAGGPTHNLINTMVGIIEKLCKGKSV